MSHAVAAPEAAATRTVEIPARLVPYFEAAIRRRNIPAGVRFNDDGSRVYTVDADDWDEQAVLSAAEEGLAELRATLAGSVRSAGSSFGRA